ncbi:MAG: DUF3418 domain-containing protein, partial [Opitutaceae bacterium]
TGVPPVGLKSAEYGRDVRATSEPGQAAQGISAVAELVDLVRERRGAEPDFLMMGPDDLRDPATLAVDAAAFPEALPLENSALPLNYAYKPGQVDDGVTLDVNVREAEALTPAALDWAVPGHLEAKVEHYLRAVPKELRRSFVPLGETSKSVAVQLAQRDRLTGRREPLLEALCAVLRERFRVAVAPELWADKPLPDHLRVRIRVLDDGQREIGASRELPEIRAALATHARAASATIAREEPEAWRRARSKWEKSEQTAWTFGDIPERIEVAEQAGVPVFAFPGLRAGLGGVALQLFKTPEEAHASTVGGLAALLERQLSHDLGWLERDLRALRNLGPLTATLAPMDELQAQAFQSIRRWLIDARRVGGGRVIAGMAAGAESATQAARIKDDSPRLGAAEFSAAVERAKAELRGFVPRYVDLLREILGLRQELLVQPKPYPGLDKDLAALIPPDFLRVTPYPQLSQLSRYLRAMKLRSERWRQNPTKDGERAAQLAPYVAAVGRLNVGRVPSPANAPRRGEGTPPTLPDEAVQRLRWLVEEFRVSVFAQELGTMEPVSAVKLDRAMADLGGFGVAGAAPSRASDKKPVTTPSVLPLTGSKKATPLKNLGALDKLFPR